MGNCKKGAGANGRLLPFARGRFGSKLPSKAGSFRHIAALHRGQLTAKIGQFAYSYQRNMGTLRTGADKTALPSR